MYTGCMLNKVQNYIDENGLFNKEDKLLLGLSGGRDSVVLLHVLINLGYQVTVAHCNFNLRGKESDDETDFVQELCRAWSVECHVKRFDTSGVKNEIGSSIQMIARSLRYDWFRELKQGLRLNLIITAHQLDDQVETFFINFSRGTGLKGLLGIPKKRGGIVRPLLSVTRDEITSYAEGNNLKFKDDSSNEKEVYLRNKIRHSIVPEFKSLNPSFHRSFSKTVTHLKQVQDFWERSYHLWLKGWVVKDVAHFIFDEISDAGEESFLTYYLNNIGFSYADVQGVVSKNKSHRNGAVLLSSTHRLLFDRGEWVLTLKVKAEKIKYYITEMDLPITLNVMNLPYDRSMKIPVSNNVVWIDMKKVEGKLFIRRWEHGDVFFPLGMSNKKKLSDYFIDNKFSRGDKEQIWLLCDEKSIIWIIGNRLDDRYKVTDQVKEIIEIKVQY
ncbi:MAG: tRNA(Ile)-lysidine synthase [Saprospiraceae bacterium]|jgi:tRNA(Ile)-lysidine synthase